MQTETEY